MLIFQVGGTRTLDVGDVQGGGRGPGVHLVNAGAGWNKTIKFLLNCLLLMKHLFQSKGVAFIRRPNSQHYGTTHKELIYGTVMDI